MWSDLASSLRFTVLVYFYITIIKHLTKTILSKKKKKGFKIYLIYKAQSILEKDKAGIWEQGLEQGP